jgi:hypothetical protein
MAPIQRRPMSYKVKESISSFKETLRNQGVLVFIMVFFVLFLIFLSPLVIWKFFQIELVFPYSKPIADELTFLYYVLITTITAIIAFFTYKQFNHLNENMKVDYLLKIDERWGSAEIIRARMVIHGLYTRSKQIAENQQSNQSQRQEIGNAIIRLSLSEAGHETEEFIYILNFLDFMETIGYFHSTGQLSEKDLVELFGDSIKFNFEVLKPYIDYRRKHHNNAAFSKEFEKLYLSMSS